MELLLNNKFQTLGTNELETIDGGIDWDAVGLTVATGGGALLGARIGAGIGSLGGPVGTVVGGAAGAIIYTLWD